MDEYITALNDYKKSNGKPLTQKSKDTYIRNMTNLTTKHGYDWRIPHLHDTYLKQFSLSQQINYINAIINYLDLLKKPEETILIYKNERDRLSEIRNNAPINPKKAQNLATWEEIIKWRDLVIKKNEYLSAKGNVPMDKLQVEAFLRLYTTYQRRNEYADLIYNDDTPKFNISKEDMILQATSPNVLFYNTTTDELQLMLADYKTNGKYGNQVLDIRDTADNLNLKTFLLKYITLNERKVIMFQTPKSKEPMSRLNLTKLLNRSSKEMLNKIIASDRIRKAYNTSKYGDIKKSLTEDVYNNAHGVNTIMNNYVVD
tara:strand:- start:818 stop:1762 length:945 start_codon:yes stop_codon:yes gene_type:complete